MRTFAQHGTSATGHEQAVATVLATYGFKCQLTDKFAHHDIEVTKDGKPFAIVEVKGRRMEWGQYPTVHVSESKIARCLDRAVATGVAFLFAVVCDSGIFIANLTHNSVADLPRKRGGRSDRGLAHDIETLIDIPTCSFIKL
jgi:hypothetical protein